MSGDDLMKSATGGVIASTADWEKKSADIRKSVVAMLGTEPPMLTPSDSAFRLSGGGGCTTAAGTLRHRPAVLDQRAAGYADVGGPTPNPGQVTPNLPAWVIGNGGQFVWLAGTARRARPLRGISCSAGLAGDLYYPKDTPAGKKLPTVIWLHGYSYPLGYMWVYHSDLHPILALVHAGYAVLAYDQSGFGSRLSETGAVLRSLSEVVAYGAPGGGCSLGCRCAEQG